MHEVWKVIHRWSGGIVSNKRKKVTLLSVEDKAKKLEAYAREQTTNGSWMFYLNELAEYDITPEEIDDVVLALSCMYDQVADVYINDVCLELTLFGDFEE